MGCSSSAHASPYEVEASSPAAAPPLSLPRAAAEAPTPGNLSRRLTARSVAMVETLDGLEAELVEMQAVSDAAADALAGSHTGLPVGLRSELASLHGDANKLLATRLDAIVTAELTTGRDEARAKRKALVAATEVLIERTEQHIKQIDSAKAGDEQ